MKWFKIICISGDLNAGELRKLYKQNKTVDLRNMPEKWAVLIEKAMTVLGTKSILYRKTR